MKNITIKTLELLLFISLTSCISIKPNSIKNTLLDTNNLDQINGFYSNESSNKRDLYNASLWNQFFYHKKDTLERWQNHKIELEVINRKRISAKLWLNDSIISKKILKGKIGNGYFSINRKVRVLGIPFIYFSTKDNKMEIGLNENNQLILNSARSQYLNIFIMSGGNSHQLTGEYERK